MRAGFLVVWAVGCQVQGGVELRDETSTLGPEGTPAVTWYDDVGPLLLERCGSCHRTGGIGSFSMETYEDAKPWAAAMVDAIDSGRMPPWAARDSADCTPEYAFKDDPRLDEAERKLVRQWVDDGARAGEPRDLALPDLGDLEAPNAVVSLQEPYAVTGDRDIYRCFRIEVPHDQDVWLTGMQVIPDNDAVVHHVLVWNDPLDQSASRVGPDGSYPCSGEPDVWPTDLIGGWAPGQPVVRNPEHTGTLFKAGASIVVNVHYHPTGDSTELDQTEIALEWTTEQPPMYATYYLVDIPFGARSDGDFDIPAGEAAHTEEISFSIPSLPLPIDFPIFAVMPHMHYRGTEMQVWLERDGDPADPYCLINAEDYRFDFQNTYYYDIGEFSTLQGAGTAMPTMRADDVMKIRCTYDNSWDNPFMADALEAAGETDLVSVGWGEETGDEMCMAVLGFVIPPVDISQWL